MLLAFSLYAFNKDDAKPSVKILFLLMLFASLSLFCLYGVSHYFTGKGINEAVIYYFRYGLNGAGFLEYKYLIIGSATVLVFGSLVLIAIALIKGEPKHLGSRSKLLCYTSLFLSLLLNPASINIYGLIPKYSIFNSESSKDNVFQNYYNEPRLTSISSVKKNLVYIYAESLERTYFDENIFPGLTSNLKKLERKSTSFSNISQIGGTGWTMGGITASQFGIPLITPSHGNSMSGMDQFLPAAIGLGDLLSEAGYHLAFMGGARLEFGGKGKLFSSHGFDEILGLDELITQTKDPSYVSAWGLYDDSLLGLVYKRFLELSASEVNFGLYTLTLDTHGPRGHTSKSVREIKYGDGSNSMLNTVAQSDRLLAEFITKIMESPFGDNTVIVLASDHLAMENGATGVLMEFEEQRRNLFMIIESDPKNGLEVKGHGTPLDIAPTILPFLGFKGEIGLGRNLLLDTNQNRTELTFIQNNVRYWNNSISNFWSFPTIDRSIKIDINNELVHIGNRSFRFPILIEINEDFETVMKFQFNKSDGQKSLIDHLNAIDEEKSFILIDNCKNAHNLAEFANPDLIDSLGLIGYYIAIGKQGKLSKIENVTSKKEYAFSELQRLVEPTFKVHRIAHAGGMVDNSTYTNSFEALNFNINKGFVYFELDFSFTLDNQLVCLQDWEGSFRRSFGFDSEGKVNLAEFRSLVAAHSKFSKCTLDGLATWMSENPSAYIVTDVKANNLKALELILKELPDAKYRVIPQIYKPENFNSVKRLGFNQIIWTLYRFPISNEEVIDWADKFYGPFAIAMPTNRAKSKLALQLSNKGVPTYAHTINSVKVMNNINNNLGVTEIFTDSIHPDRNLFDGIRDFLSD